MTTITDPGSPRVQAIFLKAHLGLYALGMRHSILSGSDILNATSKITGKTYKRGQYTQARADLIKWQEQNP